MAENKMKEVAKLLGVKFRNYFKITNYDESFILTENGIIDSKGNGPYSTILCRLLEGNLEIQKPILDDVEKLYLENVLRPFKNRIMYIEKIYEFGYEQIRCRVSLPLKEHGNEYCILPCFNRGTMYKNMETNIEYTLEELGLFKED